MPSNETGIIVILLRKLNVFGGIEELRLEVKDADDLTRLTTEIGYKILPSVTTATEVTASGDGSMVSATSPAEDAAATDPDEPIDAAVSATQQTWEEQQVAQVELAQTAIAAQSTECKANEEEREYCQMEDVDEPAKRFTDEITALAVNEAVREAEERAARAAEEAVATTEATLAEAEERIRYEVDAREKAVARVVELTQNRAETLLRHEQRFSNATTFMFNRSMSFYKQRTIQLCFAALRQHAVRSKYTRLETAAKMSREEMKAYALPPIVLLPDDEKEASASVGPEARGSPALVPGLRETSEDLGSSGDSVTSQAPLVFAQTKLTDKRASHVVPAISELFAQFEAVLGPGTPRKICVHEDTRWCIEQAASSHRPRVDQATQVSEESIAASNATDAVVRCVAAVGKPGADCPHKVPSRGVNLLFWPWDETGELLARPMGDMFKNEENAESDRDDDSRWASPVNIATNIPVPRRMRRRGVGWSSLRLPLTSPRRAPNGATSTTPEQHTWPLPRRAPPSPPPRGPSPPMRRQLFCEPDTLGETLRV